MKGYELLDAVGGVDEKYVLHAMHSERKKPKTVRLLLAACIGIFLVAALAGAAFVAEANEYGRAVEFFNENGLSMDGLSRSDVKAVYRDITTKSFTYEKTAEVITHSVPGTEIIENTQVSLTPDELKALWDGTAVVNREDAVPVKICKTDFLYKHSDELGFEIFDKSVVECSFDGNVLWKAEFPGTYVDGYLFTDFGTVVWSRNYTWSSEQTFCGYLSLVDENGGVLWTKKLEHADKNEFIENVIDNGNGTLAVFSRVDYKALCLSRYDANGNELGCKVSEVGNYGISNAARIGEDYLVQLWNMTSYDTARIIKLDRDGNILDNYVYESEDSDYYITDMIEFGGNVYLSTYAVPKQTDDGGRYEIGNILKYIFDEKNMNITDEELTPLVRDNYTAVLLLCEPEGGAPKTFYSVKGSLGGKLSVSDDGSLEWQTQSVVSTFFSPITSSFTVGGVCKVYSYKFDISGSLVSGVDTGRTEPYRR